jgi:hypothetical protein
MANTNSEFVTPPILLTPEDREALQPTADALLDIYNASQSSLDDKVPISNLDRAFEVVESLYILCNAIPHRVSFCELGDVCVTYVTTVARSVCRDVYGKVHMLPRPQSATLSTEFRVCEDRPDRIYIMTKDTMKGDYNIVTEQFELKDIYDIDDYIIERIERDS